MKKFLTFLTLLTALSWLPTGVFAQELTVADGTEQTGYVPVYGLYADMNQQNRWSIRPTCSPRWLAPKSPA